MTEHNTRGALPARLSFARRLNRAEIPDLFEMQTASFGRFLQLGVAPEDRVDDGLQAAFLAAFPVTMSMAGATLEFVEYQLEEPKESRDEAKARRGTWAGRLSATFELVVPAPSQVVRETVFCCEIPWMAADGTFLVNGTERVVLGQFVRAPGVYFTEERPKGKKPKRWATFVPRLGSSLKMDIDRHGRVRLRGTRLTPLPLVLRGLGWSRTELDSFELCYPDEVADMSPESAARAALEKLGGRALQFYEDARERLEYQVLQCRQVGGMGRRRIDARLRGSDCDVPIQLQAEDLAQAGRFLADPDLVLDDPESLDNKRVRHVGELLGREMTDGLRSVARKAGAGEGTRSLASYLKFTALAAAVNRFFRPSELVQIVDDLNPLARLTHVRRLTALGRGGLTRKGTQVRPRDVQATQYGRICPVETPEGPSVGLVFSPAIHCTVDHEGFLRTPLVRAGEEEPSRLSVVEERGKPTIPAGASHAGPEDGLGLLARLDGDVVRIAPEDVGLEEVAPGQFLGISPSLIPFVEHDDANRALMGSNMMRQAMPLQRTRPPRVGTGLEGLALRRDSSRADRGPGGAEFALGADLLVAFMSYDGWNFEDGIVVSERVVREGRLSVVDGEEFVLDCHERGEEITRDIPYAGRRLRYLAADGMAAEGARLRTGDVAIGRVRPKERSERTPEQTLVEALFPDADVLVRDASLSLPPGLQGVVVDAKKVLAADAAAAEKLPKHVRQRGRVQLRRVRNLEVGDKLAGRHGNKGVVALIVPDEDMPFLPDGRAVEVLLSPLGVPSRMNVGQLLEAQLGWASEGLGERVSAFLEEGPDLDGVRSLFLEVASVVGDASAGERIAAADPEELESLAKAWSAGIPFASPPFDGASEDQLRRLLELGGRPPTGRSVLFDGRTGEPFEQDVTVGVMHMLRLHHIADEKLAARSRGSYDRLTQQPTEGRRRKGGQRLGEMEVWALEAHGAAYNLQECLTLKSDDVVGRETLWHRVVHGKPITVDFEIEEQSGTGSRVPAAFEVLVAQMKALCLDARIGGERFRIALASPKTIKKWSHGPIRSFKGLIGKRPVLGGLFCETIFGPLKGDPTVRQGRRTRFGHVELAVPVAHPWFAAGRGKAPSPIADLLAWDQEVLEEVMGYRAAIVVDGGETGLESGLIIDQDRWDEARWDPDFRAESGAGAVRRLLESVDLEASTSATAGILREGRVHPEWMVLTRLPVLPPDLRPQFVAPDGREVGSDLNALYSRVVERNERLVDAMRKMTPEVLLADMSRSLQQAVDALLVGDPTAGTRKGAQPLRSLTDEIKGKTGRFRRNLLGKRVDFSARAVIAPGPGLGLGQCGLPKEMALELFRPFLYRRLLELDRAGSPRDARRIVDRRGDRVWDLLGEVCTDHPVLLNRAPTLHRPGVLAFYPVLVDGSAILLHPLVCAGFNADFDGDQMAVHLPIQTRARREASARLSAVRNVLHPANGSVLVTPTQDAVLGLYSMTVALDGVRGENRRHLGLVSVRRAHDHGLLDLRARIKLVPRRGADPVETTCGRALLLQELNASDLPSDRHAVLDALLVSVLEGPMDRRAMGDLLSACSARRELGPAVVGDLAQRLMRIGFEQSTRAGLSIAVDDLASPRDKAQALAGAARRIEELVVERAAGRLTEAQYHSDALGIWTEVTDRVTQQARRQMGEDALPGRPGGTGGDVPSMNPVLMIVESGARGSLDQVRQLAAMRGLMAKPSGEIMETPVTASFREGLGEVEYFLSTHGARKGLIDGALRTGKAGYLTRRLVDALHSVVIRAADCGTVEGLPVGPIDFERPDGEVGSVSVGRRLVGRVASEAVHSPGSGEVLVPVGEQFNQDSADKVDAIGPAAVSVRSPVTCTLEDGVCAACYGRDPSTLETVELGEPVGVTAAQSLGEPGTQMTLRTFHLGGIAGRDITEGLEALEEVLEARRRWKHLPATAQGAAEIVAGVQKILGEHGIAVDDRHVEVVARQMTRGLPGRTKMVGLRELAQGSDSLLSAASFQRTRRTLALAALRGQTDDLRGLKENVMLGRLIPAGTGFEPVKDEVEPCQDTAPATSDTPDGAQTHHD